MIDFQNADYFKLSEMKVDSVSKQALELLVEEEEVISAYKGIRDYVVFTNKRIMAVNVQGITGKKKDFTSIPYSKIVAYSVETAGTFDLDSELDIFLSGVGKVRFEFTGATNIKQLSKIISNFIL